MLSLEDEKRNWRATMRQRRAAIALPERATAAVALVEIWRRERPVLTPRPDGRPTVVAGFWPKGDEIDVGPLRYRRGLANLIAAESKSAVAAE